MGKKKAFITGISGQDGSYLAELLLSKDYEVHGLVLRNEFEAPQRYLSKILQILPDIHLYPGSIESYPSILNIIQSIQPDECYHLAASSFVSYSFDDEFMIFNSNINGTHHVLSALKEGAPKSKFYFAASSELFGNADHYPQTEETRFNPRSTYGISKVAGYYLTTNYRRHYGMFACNGILYNHESPRRGVEFVTKKVAQGAAQIKCGRVDELLLGNLEAKRDWGYAPDYVAAMWMMLQQPKPDDYLVATGELHSVRELCSLAFDYVGLDYKQYVKEDPTFFRTSEDIPLVGDYSKAKRLLGWEPKKTFAEMIREMVDYELQKLNG